MPGAISVGCPCAVYMPFALLTMYCDRQNGLPLLCILLNVCFSAGSNPTLGPVIDRSGRRTWTTCMGKRSKPRHLPMILTAVGDNPAVSFLCPSQLDAVRFRQLSQRFRKPSMRVL